MPRYKGSTYYLAGWVASGSQPVLLGILPIASYVARVHVHCTTAFNGDGTDNITVGYTGTTNAFSTNADVSTTGVKTITLGANIGYQTVSREINAYYVNGGSEPTTGRALVIVEFFLAAVVP